MRAIKSISIHCTDTDNPKHDNIATIRAWHTDPARVGGPWIDVGYHYFIRRDNTIEIGRPHAVKPAAVMHFNDEMIAIALHGRDPLKFPDAQILTCAKLCLNIMWSHSIPLEEVRPHNFWEKGKTCPNFKIERLHEMIVSEQKSLVKMYKS